MVLRDLRNFSPHNFAFQAGHIAEDLGLHHISIHMPVEVLGVAVRNIILTKDSDFTPFAAKWIHTLLALTGLNEPGLRAGEICRIAAVHYFNEAALST